MITYTRDGKGFLLDCNGKNHKQLMYNNFMGSHSRCYKNSPVVLHFNYDLPEGGIDYRHTLYNKTVGLICNESLGKKIGMGTKALFNCSTTMRSKHSESRDTCLFRHELTKEINSVEEEEAFFLG
jgi:hypothetical protein